MKIIPVILSGGAGTRLWPKSKKISLSSLLILVVGHYFKKLLKELKIQFLTIPLLVQIYLI